MAAQPEPNALYLVMRRANSMRRTAKPPANVENRRLCLIAPNDALLCQAGDHRRGCRDRQHGAVLRWSRLFDCILFSERSQNGRTMPVFRNVLPLTLLPVGSGISRPLFILWVLVGIARRLTTRQRLRQS